MYNVWDVKAVLGERRGVQGREEGQGGRKCLGKYFFKILFIIFGLTIMATVYEGKG